MKKPKGLVIIHVDGLGHAYLQKALRQGQMPFVTGLIEEEGYQALRYRSGLPSATPFCQAGVLYGDNSEIPAFRWWDKQSGIAISFDRLFSFNHVAHKYFRDCEPLTAGGASIATCFPDSAKPISRSSRREHSHSWGEPHFSQKRVIQSWAMNPVHLLDWLRRGVWELFKMNVRYWRTRLLRRRAAKMYVVTDLLDEILLHHLTRFAVIQAMKENVPIIYAAFYAYDETAHAFGPEADYAYGILRHVDYTLRHIASHRRRESNAREYELVILSDHGQIETIPFAQAYGRPFREIVAGWLPTYEVVELKGKRITRSGAVDGQVVLAYSGGLAHLYTKNMSWRLQHDEVEEYYPGLIEKAAREPGIDFVLTRDGANDVISTRDARVKFAPNGHLPRAAREMFEGYGDRPEMIARQIHKLNSFERAGDLILFGKYTNSYQINFEDQVGGHGTLGGEQGFPFILAKREWNLDTSRVTDSTGVYALLKRLRDRLVT